MDPTFPGEVPSKSAFRRARAQKRAWRCCQVRWMTLVMLWKCCEDGKTHAQDAEANLGKNRSQDVSALVNTSMISYWDLREFDIFLPTLPPKRWRNSRSWGKFWPVCPWCCPLWPDWQRWWAAEAKDLRVSRAAVSMDWFKESTGNHKFSH